MINKAKLERLYRKYNRREFVHPDPVEFLYGYEDLCDREIVAFVASSLAYGRVAQIHKSVARALQRMIPSPSVFLQKVAYEKIHRTFADYKHRVTTGQKFACMLFGLKQIIERYGSLQACFLTGLNNEASPPVRVGVLPYGSASQPGKEKGHSCIAPLDPALPGGGSALRQHFVRGEHAGHDTILPALTTFTTELTTCANDKLGHLVPCPTNGSACKRLNLFLRWMVRHDQVDPGGWEDVPASKLIVPVDIHMHRVCLSLGLTRRKQADMRTALEITEAFREIATEDPVRYDFVLTRRAIRGEADLIAFLTA